LALEDIVAADGDALIGQWQVRCGPYLWEYTFESGGAVRWRDPFNNQTGQGKWAQADSVVKFTWLHSRTKEFWDPPESGTSQTTGHVSASYGEHDLTAVRIPGTTPAEISAAVTAAEREVNDLYQTGKITFTNTNAEAGFKQAMKHEQVGGAIARHTVPLLRTMITLTEDAGSLRILRSFASEDGPHGTGGLCQAMDISAYGDYVFEYRRGSRSLIDGVCKLIRAVPDDISFDLGLVRPVGGVGGFNTTLDVFFRVTADNVVKLKRDPETHKVLPGQAPNAVEPGQGWGFFNLLTDARRAIDVARRGKKFVTCYPDGADHVHIKAY